jgi:alpha-methylacyl-CoA racemase
MNSGPLAGLRVLELAGIGPAPHACMLLADLGADVIRIDRIGSSSQPVDYMLRGRVVVEANLKDPQQVELTLKLVEDADVLVEGYRPGVVERLGLGPAVCLNRNPRLVFGRMTGWGQDGTFARAAGHDINFISITGILDSIGRKGERPVPPLNLVGDFGGGSMFLVMGLLAALWERDRSGRGQIVDAAMCEGASVLAQVAWAMRGLGTWSSGRGANLVDGSRPYYDTYECADGRYMAVGCIEPRFFSVMLALLGLDPARLPEQNDLPRSQELREAIGLAFKSKSMQDWTAIFAGTDACVTPVLTWEEAAKHPHMIERGAFTTIGGVEQPRPAPRFSRSIGIGPRQPRAADLAGIAWPRSPAS